MSQEFVLISCFDDSHKLLRKYARLWKYLWFLEKFCSTFGYSCLSMIKVWNIKALCNWNLWHSWQGKILGKNFSKGNSIQTLKALNTIGMK